MPILGGRYGSIEEESGLNYTELEYRYALSKNMPVSLLPIRYPLHDTQVTNPAIYNILFCLHSSPTNYNLCSFPAALRDL